MNRLGPVLASLLMLAMPLAAQDAEEKAPQPDPKAQALQDIADALQAQDAAKARELFDHLETLAPRIVAKDPSDMDEVVAALGGCIKKTVRRSPQVAVLAVETLGDLQVAGSSRLIAPLLRPPSKVKEADLPLYLAAIEAAGEIHDPATFGALQKLLKHKSITIAVAAAKALAGYRALDHDSRLKLIDKLAKDLATIETKSVKARGDEQLDHYRTLMSHLRASLSKLAASSAATTAKEWRVWVRTEQRKQRKRKLAETVQ